MGINTLTAPPLLTWTSKLTSTQVGAIAEAMVAAALTLHSNGRFGLYRPFADDDGLDLLVYDKLTRVSLPIQIKARMGLDGPKGATVQFNVRQKTFSSETRGYLLAVLMDGLEISCSWLIPAASLQEIAYARADQLIVVASAAESSKDRFVAHRHLRFENTVAALTASFSARAVKGPSSQRVSASHN